MQRPFAGIFFLLLFAGCASVADYSTFSDKDLRLAAKRCVSSLAVEASPEGRGPDLAAVFENQSVLVRMGARAVSPVADALDNAPKKSNLKIFLVPVLGAAGTDEALGVLRKTLAAKGMTSVKDECAIALGNHADEAALGRLMKIASRRKYPVRRARAIAALARYEGNTEVENFLKGLLDDKTPVVLSQKVLWGVWPLRGYTWVLKEGEIRDFARAALLFVTGSGE